MRTNHWQLHLIIDLYNMYYGRAYQIPHPLWDTGSSIRIECHTLFVAWLDHIISHRFLRSGGDTPCYSWFKLIFE